MLEACGWSHTISAHACFASAEGWESTVLAGINTWSEKGTVPIQTRAPNGGWNETLLLPTRIHLGQMTLVRSRVRVSLLNEPLSLVIPATR